MNVAEAIKKIENELSVVELIRHYSELTPKGKNFTGKCPFCNSKKSFTVSKGKNIFKCFQCGTGGNPIRFIMAYENMSFKEAIDFIVIKFCETLNIPENFTTDPIRGDVYVLQLVDGCYYIGFTRNLERRMKEHFSGNGSIWTRIHKPIKIVETHPDKTLNYENYLTQNYTNEYGYMFVRGGDHIYFKRKYEDKLSTIPNK